MNQSISALILAAGTSSRMGEPKQLLRLGDSLLLEHTIYRLLNERFAEVLAVIGHQAEEIRTRVQIDNTSFKWIENKDYLTGQSSSLKKGVEYLKEDHSNAMVFLSDLPFISEETVDLIYKAGKIQMNKSETPFVIRPTYKNVPGHPVFFGNINQNLFAELEGDTGGKSIMNRIPNRILIKVEDSGILFDIDTPDDYTKAKLKWRESNE
ncbi:nucleotidyltransferase family protein [Sporosarcina sp. CAU 1771]